VIEHLSNQQLWDLIALSYQKLQPGGIFLAETPNPQCLLVFAESFYMDPTHLRPVHPLTLKFAAELAGFKTVHFHHSSPADDFKIPRLKASGSIENIQEFNDSIEKVNRVLFGYRDYAIVATK
jgi:hypothetical protein